MFSFESISRRLGRNYDPFPSYRTKIAIDCVLRGDTLFRDGKLDEAIGVLRRSKILPRSTSRRPSHSIPTSAWLFNRDATQDFAKALSLAPHDAANVVWLYLGEARRVAKSMEDLQLAEAPSTVEAALAISSLKFSHGDPADHFLAATARVLDFTLVTGDEHLMNLQGIRTLPNR